MTDGQTDGRTDGQTDGQTDGIAIAYARLAYMLSRAKSENSDLYMEGYCSTSFVMTMANDCNTSINS